MHHRPNPGAKKNKIEISELTKKPWHKINDKILTMPPLRKRREATIREKKQRWHCYLLELHERW
jgi:hypothetical protein